MSPINLGVGISRVGEEQLLAIDLIVGDGFLTFRRYQRIDEWLTDFGLHVRMFGRGHRYTGLLVDHAFVVFNENWQVTPVLEVYPRRAVGQDIAIAGDRHLERSIHTLVNRCVPGAAVVLDIDPEVLVPDHEFLDMGARTIAPRYERRRFGLDRFKRLRNVLQILNARGIALWPDQYEIIVHDGNALHTVAFVDEPILRRFVVHQHDVGLAASARIERLTGALREHFHVDTDLLCKEGQDVVEQPTVLRRGRRRDND